MLPYYWKDTCLLSPPRGPLGLDFYSLRLFPARAKGSGQECPLYTSQSSGHADLVMLVEYVPQRLNSLLKTRFSMVQPLKGLLIPKNLWHR
jgi:hypothetical protein